MDAFGLTTPRPVGRHDRSLSACFEDLMDVNPVQVQTAATPVRPSESVLIPMESVSSDQPVLVGEVAVAGDLTSKKPKVRFGGKAKFAFTAGLLSTLATLFATTALQVYGVKRQNFDADSFLKSVGQANPKLLTTDPANGFRIWERTQPQNDGLPYYDADFEKVFPADKTTFREHRSASTTPSPLNETDTNPTTTTPPVIGTEIDFTNFACNIVARQWACSKSGSPFCVFFTSAVPAAKRISVRPMSESPEPTTPAERRMLKAKCPSKISVSYAGAPPAA